MPKPKSAQGDTPSLFARLLPASALCAAAGLALTACQVEDKKGSEPSVVTVNNNYNRLHSHVLVRRIKVPTEANLDFAAYSRNVMLADPDWKAAHPPAKLKMESFGFNGLLQDPKAVVGFTALTDAEKAHPLAWTPVLEHLLKWNFEKTSELANAYSNITGEKWGDTTEITQPYQEFGALYVHRNGNVKEVWVELEFKPFLNSFLEGVQDEDRDGFPAVFARIDSRVFTAEMVDEIAGDYSTKVLTEPQVIDWARNLASRWYPSYNTDLLPLKAGSAWPYEETPADSKKEMAGTWVTNPLFILQGHPFADTLYNAFEVEGMGTVVKTATQQRKEGKPIARGLDKGLTARLEAITARMNEEKKSFGKGDWLKWIAGLGAFQKDVKKFSGQEPDAIQGLLAPDKFLVFRRELDYLTAPDWSVPGAPQSPVPAIAAFKDELAAQGIDFLFVPIPTKLDIYPEYLAPKTDTLPGHIAQPMLRKLIADLADARVETLDLLTPFLKIKSASDSGKRMLYQRQDTHWSTVGLEAAAQLVSERVKNYSWYDSVFRDKRDYRAKDTTFESLGDIQARLPDSKKGQVAPESLLGRQVVDGKGALYEDNDSSAVLVLGDSYTGVYQTVGCRHAGVTAHLAKDLGGPVDLIMGWGGGPEAPAKLKKRGEDYLQNKRLVIWMMSARDLFVYPGGWAAK
jgi:alginate O-acetyltransferase complex protein AlgJ